MPVQVARASTSRYPGQSVSSSNSSAVQGQTAGKLPSSSMVSRTSINTTCGHASSLRCGRSARRLGLSVNGRSPTVATATRLHLPLQQVRGQHGQSVDRVALLAATQGFDLPGDVADVGGIEPMLPQQGGLPGRPGAENAVAEFSHALMVRPSRIATACFSILRRVRHRADTDRVHGRAHLDIVRGHG